LHNNSGIESRRAAGALLAGQNHRLPAVDKYDVPIDSVGADRAINTALIRFFD
jgi:hypothetical protein